MSIAGLYPPICDYNDGHLLLDGCYTNNVPGKVCFWIIFNYCVGECVTGLLFILDLIVQLLCMTGGWK